MPRSVQSRAGTLCRPARRADLDTRGTGGGLDGCMDGTRFADARGLGRYERSLRLGHVLADRLAEPARGAEIGRLHSPLSAHLPESLQGRVIAELRSRTVLRFVDLGLRDGRGIGPAPDGAALLEADPQT